MRLLWLADVLRAAGLTVHEYDGWRTRGLESFGPVRGIVCHGTAGSLTSSDAGELRVIAITGSNSATAPIAQLYLSRSGAWWVVASGTCTGVVSGTGGPLEGYSDDAVLQIEAQHAKDEPWSAAQYGSYVRGVAALARHRVSGYEVPLAHVIGHYEHQPTGPNTKSDPWFDMNRFRADVAAVLNGGDDVLSETDKDILLARVEALTLMKDTLGWSNEKGQEVQIVKAVKDIAAKVAALEIPAPAPVDPTMLKAALLDPGVLAAIAKAVNDDAHRRTAE